MPPGLQIELPLDGVSARRARIPPSWRLQLWVDSPLLGGFWRADVTRGMRVAALNDAATEALRTPVRLQFGGGARGAPVRAEEIDAAATAEEAALWTRQAELRLAAR